MSTYPAFRGRHSQQQSAELLPLAVPAMVIASVMLIGALVRLSVVSGWARDYGPGLVYFALIVYLALVLRMLWWGVTLWGTRLVYERNGMS